ncbi:mucin-binding protein [Weissella confusa]|uniref:mucin-binding protein n=1 Tax=Weissella confusa TaxID=1583 RepID=UPI0022E72531|nr:hypothetical protein [Weissella confusa]
MAATPNYDTTSNGTSTTDATPQNFTVTYKADTQSIQINFKMADGSTPPASITASGKTGAAIAQTVTAPAGYHFATTAEISANPSYAVATTGTKVLKFDGVSSVTGSYDDTNNNGATTDSSPQTMTLTLVPDKQEIQIKFVVDRGTATAPSNISVSGASNAALDSKSTMTVQSGVTLTDGGVTITAPKIPTGYSIDVAATNADAANTAGKLTFTSDGLTATVSGMYDTTANGAATTDGTPQVYVIHLVQDDAKVNVVYIDVDGSTKTTGFTPSDGAEVPALAQALKGGAGQSYSNTLSDYEKLGYVLATQDAGATSGTYDMVPDDASTSQTYYVYLKHDTTTVTPSTPGEPGQPVNPDNPDSPLYPADNTAYKTTQEIKQITNYVVTDGGVANPPSYTQTTNWGREVTLDKVTGEVISATDWQVLSENDNGSDVTSADDDWHAVDSPVIDGYYADKAVIPAETITQDSFASTDYTQTNTVTYTKLGNYVPSFPDDTTVPSVPYGNDPDDPTSPSTPSIPYVPGYTPHDPDGNPLTPIDPEDPEKGYVPPTPKNPGQDTPINYTADEQVAEVIYIDDTTGQQLRKDALNGKTNQTSTYLTADQIAAYVAAGYTFVSDDTPNPLVFDDVADFDSEGYPIKTSQIYEVHLKQVVVTVDPSSPLNPGDNPFTPGDPVDPSDPSSPTYPSTPGEPGQPVDPSNPSGPTWPATPTAPEGLQEQDLNKTVTRTIHYWYTAVNGEKVQEDVVQTVQYAREGYLNAVTGAVTYGAWQAVATDGTDDTLDAVNSPVKTGWVADKPSVAAVTNPVGTTTGDANDTKISALKDTEENVVYTKMGQYVPSIPANPGGSTPSTPEPITYPNDPDDPTEPREPDPSGEPGTPDNPTIPYVPGYTPNDPNEPHNPLVPVDPDDPSKGYWPPATPEDPTKDTVIVYTPDDQKAQVTYIDQDTGLSLAIDPLVGDTNTKSDYTTVERIRAFEQQGYVLVSDGFTAANPDGLTFDANTGTVQEYEVYLKHVVLTIEPDDPQNPSTPVFNPGDPVDPDNPSGPTYPATPGTPGEPIDPDNPSGPTWPATPTYPDGLKATDLNNTVDLTVHYVYEDGQMAHEDYTDNVKFTRTATLDTVTGKVTYSEWTPVNADNLLDTHKSPVIEGYYASAEYSTAVTAAALDKPYEQTITYKKLGAYVPSFPDTVTDVPSDPQQYPNDPDDPTTPLEPDGNPNTPGSPDNPTLPYVPGYTPEDPNGDPLKPVDPENPSKGYWPPATPGSPVDPTDPNSPTVPGNPGDDTTIKYVADEQKVTIQYYDDDSKTMLAADDVFGDSDTTVDYTTAERIKAYEQAGYILVTDGFTTADGRKYDHDTATDQVFTVHLKQSTVTVDPSTPGEPGDPVFTPGDPIDPANPSGPTYPAEPGDPGEPIDPANPSGPTWPETPTYPTGLSQTDLNKTVTRTIRYWITKVDGTKAAETVTQTVTYSRVAHYNPITQAITYDPWIASETDGTNTTLDEVVSPVVAGYVADKPSVGATTYATGSASGDANDQAISDAPVSTIVDVIYMPLGSYVPSFPAGEKTPSVPEVPYGNNPDDPTTPAEPGEPGSPTLPYVPGYTPSSPNGPVTPIYPGDPVDPSDPSSPTYPENPDKPDTPIGYTPPATPSDPATDTPIIYNADKQYATVTFIDDDTKQTLAVDKLSGGSNTRSTYLTDDKIKAYEAAGYTLVSDDYPDGGMVFDDDGKVNQSYTVHLKHTTVTVDPSSPQDPSTPIYDNPSDPESPNYPGDTTPGDPGTPVNPDAPTYPDTPGTPGDPVDPSDPSSPTYPGVPGTPVFPDDPSSPTYPSTPVTPGDPVDPSDPSSPTYPGVPGTPVDPNTPTWPATPTYPAGVDQKSLNETVTRTITYTYLTEDGDEAAPTYTNSSSFSRVATVDTVTGKVTYGNWVVLDNDDAFGEVISPVIDGYYASIASIGRTDGLTADSPDEVYHVVYKKLGAYVPSIPSTPGSTSVPATPDPITYPNDPNDPTTPENASSPDNPGGYVPGEPTDPTDPDSEKTPSIPYVPGYTPHGPNGDPLVPVDPDNPSSGYYPPATPGSPINPGDPNSPTVPGDPGTDTPIIYEANKQYATITFIDDTTGKTLTVDAIAGPSNSTSSYSTADKIKAYEAAGYVYVSDNYPKDFAFDNDDQTTQAYEVHLTHAIKTLDPSTPGDPSTPIYEPGDPIDPNDPSSPTYPDQPGEPGTPVNPDAPTYPAEPGTPGEPIDPTDPSSPTYPGVPGTPVFPNDPDSPLYPETPVTPGDPIDPADPSSPTYPGVPGTPVDPNTPTWPATPTYPAGVTESDLNETVTRTITYSYAKDGKKAAEPVTQTLTYSRTVSIDAVTGEKTYGEWQPAVGTTLAEVKSPVITGYTANMASVAAIENVDALDADTTVAVVYTAMGQYVPEFPPGTTSVPTAPITYPNDPVDPTEPIDPGTYTPGDPVDENDPSSPTYPATPTLPYVPGFTPGAPTDPADPSSPTTPLTPIYPGDPVDPSDPDSPTYPENPDDPDTPIGYTPPATPSDPTTDTPIVYEANEQKASVTYYDDTTGTTLVVDQLTGESDTTSTYWTADRIRAFEAAGYELVSDDYPTDGVTFDRDDKVDQAFEVHLKQIVVTVDPSQPVDPSTPIFTPGEPINPDDPSSPTYPAAPGEPGTPVSPYTPTYPGTPGDPVDPSDPSSPTYPGTPGEPVDPSDPSSPTYPAPGDPVDPSDPSSPTVPTPGTPVDPSDPSSPTYPGIPGTPVDPNSPTWPATPTYPAGLQKDDLNKTVTRTITYVYENGDEAAKTVVDTVSFTRSATVNTVTGAVTYSDWQAVNDDTSFDAVKSPLISGYYATIELVAATTGLTQDSGNENYKVVYRELGAWVPSFPAGTTDVPSEPQQYPNDPADPTSPLDSGKDNPSQPGTPANPTLPYVPGFTPHAPGTPVDPDAPTWPGVPGTPVDPSDPDSPTYPDTPVTPGDPIDPSDPSSPTYPGVPGTPVDPSDPDSPTYPAEPGIPGSPLDPDTPTQPGAPLTPVDPEDPTKGYWPPDVPTNPGADTNIVYTANEQKATVTYIDDDTGATLAVDHLVGQSDKKSPYLTADQITAFETAGYQVVSDNYPKTGMTFDRDDAKDQAYVVHLKQMTVTVEPDDPKDPSTPMFTPGDPVDPNDPKSPTYPQYPGTPGTPIDPATPTYPADPGTPGEPVDPSDPSSPTYPGVPGTPVFPSDPSSPTYPETPVTPGDPVDPSDPSSPTYPVVPGTPIDPNTPTWPATPTYPAGVQEADLNKTVTRTITYTYLTIDGRTAAETVTDSVKFTRQGIVNAITGAVTYTQWQAVNDDTTFAAVKSPVISGYYASAASVAATTGLQATSANETHHVIYQPFGSWIPSVPVDAPSVPADPAGYPNDPNNPDKPMQPGDNPNTPGTPENPTMPYVPGYTPQDPDGHPLVPVDPKDPSKGYVPPAPKDPGKDTVVTYKIDSQKATITFVDETTGKTLNVTNVGGKSGEKSVYTPAAQLAAYEKQGYELVSSDLPDSGIMFDRDKAVDQHYKLVLKHKMVPIDPANPGVPGTPIDPNNPDGPKWPAGSDEDHLKTSTTRTIIFRTSDGKIVDTKTDTVTYTRTAIVDMVTGEVTYGPWTAEDGSRVPGVDVPGMPGYTADRDNVPGEDVPAGTPDYTEYVTYTPVEKHGPAIVDSNTPSQPEPGSPVTPGDPAQPGVVEQTIVPEVLMPNVGGSLAYTATQPAGSVAESGAALAYTAEQSAAASATAQHSGVLPYTGVDDQEGAKATGLAMLFGLFLGLFKRRKKNDEEDQNKSEKR